METLDVTLIEPRLKHPTIFERFDSLCDGESLTIHNDHDPKPLYYQLLAERGAIFKWEYLEEGPLSWKVMITKNTLNDGETIGEIVANDYRKAEVFKKFGLDFCCGGNKTLREACNKKGVEISEVESALKKLEEQSGKAIIDFNTMELDTLIDHIINKHHTYVNNSLPMLLELSNKVGKVHGESHPETTYIARLVAEVAEELKAHMYKEEQVLFPYVKELVNNMRDGKEVKPPQFGSVEYPIRMMEQEHETAGRKLEQIRDLSEDFTLPAEACTSYKILYAKLAEFEADLHQHVHLENNILFPKALDLKVRLFG